MLDYLKRARDRFFGEGEATVSVPIFDGALAPNNLLEEAPVFAELAGLEDLAMGPDGVLHAACGNQVLRFAADGAASMRASFDAPLQALALADDGALAVATATGVRIDGGPFHGKRLDALQGQPLGCINALHWASGAKLLISQGSLKRPYAELSHDLLEHGRSGRVLEYDCASGETRVLASGLAYCYGVCDSGAQVIAAQSWAHSVVGVAQAGKPPKALLKALPGYPARLSPAPGGGFWLSVFAGRTQLLEFVLREDDFRAEMMRTIEPRYWVAPALNSGSDFREPLQGGSVKQMGILKPWAPPRSYGLVIRLGADMLPLYSLHSRVGGVHHGIVSAVEQAGKLFVLSKGSGRILCLNLAELNFDSRPKRGAA